MNLIQIDGLPALSTTVCANSTELSHLQKEIFNQALLFGEISLVIGFVIGIIGMWYAMRLRDGNI